MNKPDCTIAPVEFRNIPVFLPERILSNEQTKLPFSGYATASHNPLNLHPQLFK
jgi:hypothetical protein